MFCVHRLCSDVLWVEDYLSLCHVCNDVSCSGWRCCTFLCAMCVVIVIIQVLLLLLPINKIFIFKRLHERM